MQQSKPLIKVRDVSSSKVDNSTTSDIMSYNEVPLKLMDYFGVTHLGMDEDTTRKLKLVDITPAKAEIRDISTGDIFSVLSTDSSSP